MIVFFFVRDHKLAYRFFSSEPPKPIEIKRSKAKESWELAKKKLMVLPQRILRQEQAFDRVLKVHESSVPIVCSGVSDEHEIDSRFHSFLCGHRTQRLFFLIGEALLLPITGLLTPLPGPNVAFYALALLTITHWMSFRGMRILLKKGHDFVESTLFAEWEQAVTAKTEEKYADILARIEKEYGLVNLRKVLWK